MSLTRRVFLKGGAMAAIGTTALPAFLTRAVYGAETNGGRKRLVVIFQRGAADGLNIVVPHGEPSYYSLRPSLAIPRPGQGGAIDLDGFFGLHPSLAAFKPLWDAKHLAIVHAAGSPDTTRSHFDAQDYMESGTPGYKGTEDGWLNRALLKEPKASPFRAVSLGPTLPRILLGGEPAVAVSNIAQFGVGGNNPNSAPIANSFEAMYDQSVDAVLHGTGRETFDAVKMLKAADPAKYQPAAGADYPRGRFGDALRETAQLLKANLGVEVAFTDIGGWDHHVNETPQLTNIALRGPRPGPDHGLPPRAGRSGGAAFGESEFERRVSELREWREQVCGVSGIRGATLPRASGSMDWAKAKRKPRSAHTAGFLHW